MHEIELHKIVHIPPGDPASPASQSLWRVDCLRGQRPAKFYASRQAAEAYLTEHNAEYQAATGMWHDGEFE